jgi:hypothetical protein
MQLRTKNVRREAAMELSQSLNNQHRLRKKESNQIHISWLSSADRHFQEEESELLEQVSRQQ